MPGASFNRAHEGNGDGAVRAARIARPHSSLDRRTPDEAYFNQPPLKAAA